MKKSNFIVLLVLSLAISSCNEESMPEVKTLNKDAELPAPAPDCGEYCCDYSWFSYPVPIPEFAGNTTTKSYTSNASIITVDDPYEHGTYVYSAPSGYEYQITFKIRKFGNPLAAKIGINGTDYWATTSWVTHTHNASDGFSAHLHTIANSSGSWGGVEIKDIYIHRKACTKTCNIPPSVGKWENIALNTNLFTLLSGSGSVTKLSSTSVKFTAPDYGVNYLIEAEEGYEYEIKWSMSYSLDTNNGEESGIYPDVNCLEYYSTNNCGSSYNPGCKYGNVASSCGGANHTYHSAGTIFTDTFYDKILFRTTTNGSGGSMTIYNFELKRRLLEDCL